MYLQARLSHMCDPEDIGAAKNGGHGRGALSKDPQQTRLPRRSRIQGRVHLGARLRYQASPECRTRAPASRSQRFFGGFFGGRTNATRLHYKAGPGQTIEYADFTSLYPSVNKQCRYPVGHPQIIVRDFGPLESYFGIAKVNNTKNAKTRL